MVDMTHLHSLNRSMWTFSQYALDGITERVGVCDEDFNGDGTRDMNDILELPSHLRPLTGLTRSTLAIMSSGDLA